MVAARWAARGLPLDREAGGACLACQPAGLGRKTLRVGVGRCGLSRAPEVSRVALQGKEDGSSLSQLLR